MSTLDPLDAGRIKVQCPQLFGPSVTDWLFGIPAQSTPPPVGSPVWIGFEAGDIDHPAWFGSGQGTGSGGSSTVALSGSASATSTAATEGLVEAQTGVHARSYQAGAWTPVVGAYTQMTFDTPNWSVGGVQTIYSSFKSTERGYYSAKAAIGATTTATNQSVQTFFNVNGVGASAGNSIVSGASGEGLLSTVADTLFLNAGDSVTVIYITYAGGAGTTGTAYSFFAVDKLP